MFDTEERGYISYEELSTILKDVMELDETYAHKIYDDLDVQKTGKVTIGMINLIVPSKQKSVQSLCSNVILVTLNRFLPTGLVFVYKMLPKVFRLPNLCLTSMTEIWLFPILKDAFELLFVHEGGRLELCQKLSNPVIYSRQNIRTNNHCEGVILNIDSSYKA